MPANIDDLLPHAKDLRRRSAIEDARKADEYVRLLTEAELEKRALIESLGRTTDVFEGDRIKLASAIIQRAARSGLCEVQIYRFSNLLCTDGGLAICNNTTGWENTLAGVPQQIYRFWSDYLQPRGYQIRCVMIGLPPSLPNNISIVLCWGD
jgi:hypothetical protein